MASLSVVERAADLLSVAMGVGHIAAAADRARPCPRPSRTLG
jgi:hypothetical protein